MPRIGLIIAVVSTIAAVILSAYVLVTIFQFDDKPQTRTTGKALVGGPFTLVDGDGRTRTAAEFKGRPLLIYFGYTYCPDVCPTELQTMSEALDLLGDAGKAIHPLFITVDPARDTPAVMKDYVGNFHPTLIGLTGTAEQVETAAKAYRVYYRRAEDGSADDYLMDHSSIVFLMDDKGEYLTHFGRGTTPEAMAAGIRELL